MRCKNCKAFHSHYDYESYYPEMFCAVEDVAEETMDCNVKNEDGCKLHWKTINKLLGENNDD